MKGLLEELLKKMHPLRRWRLANELSETEVAALTGLSLSMISRVENHERTPAPLTKVRIARRLGVAVSEIFEPDPIPDEEVIWA